MIIINGKSYSGTDVVVNNNKIIIDGKEVDTEESKQYFIEVLGDNSSVTTSSGTITVTSDRVKNVSSQSGKISINGEVVGNVSTMSGSVIVNGSVGGDISTMSGNVSHG